MKEYGKITFLNFMEFYFDSADVNKFPEAKKELEKILNTPELDNILLLF